MMTDKRKTEIIDNFLGWMIEHHKNDEDLYFTLKNVIGMKKEELNEFDIESLDEYYEKEQEKEKEETLETITILWRGGIYLIYFMERYEYNQENDL